MDEDPYQSPEAKGNRAAEDPSGSSLSRTAFAILLLVLIAMALVGVMGLVRWL